MNITVIRKYFKYFSLFISLLLTINIYPNNLFKIESLNNLLTLLRIFAPIFILFLVLYKHSLNIKNIVKIYSINLFIIIFSLIIFLQVIGGVILNRFNLETMYVAIFTCISLILFAEVEIKKIQKIYKYFLTISILFIILVIITLITFKFNIFIDNLNSGNFYGTFHPDIPLLGQSPPRSTGFSRMLAIVAVFLIVINEEKDFVKNINLKIIIYFLIVILLALTWQFQSRGSVLCYLISILVFVLILNFRKFSFCKKIFKLLIYILVPLILTYVNLANWKVNPYKNSKEPKEVFKEVNDNDKKLKKQNEPHANNFLDNRIIQKRTSSGRIELWVGSIENYKKSNLFGYGPMADRILLDIYNKKNYGNNNPYGTNVSNSFVYVFLSGGYIALLLFILFYFQTAKLIVKNYRFILENKLDVFEKISLIYIFFFSIRSLFENSFVVWGVDYVIFFISINIINNAFNKQNRL